MGPRILILRFSSIGDIVLTSPVMRCIKKQLPDSHITYITKKAFAAILDSNPYIDKVVVLEKDFNALKNQLRQEKFDHILDLHNNLRTKRLCRSLKGNYSAFHKLNIQKWLLVNFKINKLPPLHIVDRYMETAKQLGVRYDGKGLDYFIHKETPLPQLPNLPFVALAIGGQHATKRLPINKLREILIHCEVPLVLLGGKEEMHTASILENEFPQSIAYNYCGKISLDQSALVLSHAAGLMTHDTGMMHIAAALQIPVLSVWGNTVPSFGMSPLFPENSEAEKHSMVFEVNGLPCRPCSKIGFDTCPKGHFKCMNLQDTSLMAEALNRLT
ncbi:MAG TPA: glycosyl transferase [Bacteroidetes bacterium]|nr:glycosyl transferase [Bacteroidota bacterium]